MRPMAMWHQPDQQRWRWLPGGVDVQRDCYTAAASIREAYLGQAADAVTDLVGEFGDRVAAEIAEAEALNTRLTDRGWQLCPDLDVQVLGWQLPASRVPEAGHVDDMCEYTTIEVFLPLWPEHAHHHALLGVWWAGMGSDSASEDWFSMLTDSDLDRIEQYRRGDIVPLLLHEPDLDIVNLLEDRGWQRTIAPDGPRQFAQWWWPPSARLPIPTQRSDALDDVHRLFATQLTYVTDKGRSVWRVSHRSDELFTTPLSTDELLGYLAAIEHSRTGCPIVDV